MINNNSVKHSDTVDMNVIIMKVIVIQSLFIFVCFGVLE